MSQLETGFQRENSLQTEGFIALIDPQLSNPAKMRKKCCYGRRRTWGQYSSLSLSPAHPLHTTTITLSRIKWEIIFLKRSVFVCSLKFVYYFWLCFCLYLYYSYATYSYLVPWPGSGTRVWYFYGFEILQGIAEGPIGLGGWKMYLYCTLMPTSQDSQPRKE